MPEGELLVLRPVRVGLLIVTTERFPVNTRCVSYYYLVQ